jgi:hypothetical protein
MFRRPIPIEVRERVTAGRKHDAARGDAGEDERLDAVGPKDHVEVGPGERA